MDDANCSHRSIDGLTAILRATYLGFRPAAHEMERPLIGKVTPGMEGQLLADTGRIQARSERGKGALDPAPMEYTQNRVELASPGGFEPPYSP